MDPIGRAHVQFRENDSRYENTVTFILGMSGNLTLAALRERMADRFLKYERLRSRLVKEGGKYFFAECTNIDITRMVWELEIPGTTESALNSFIADRMVVPMLLTRPMWEVILLRFSEEPDKCHVFMRLHHCNCDGVAMERLFFECADPSEAVETQRPRRKNGGGMKALLTNFSPFTLSKNFCVFVAGIFSAIFLPVGPADCPSPMKVSSARYLSAKRAVARSCVSLDVVKRVKNRFGATVNDVLIAVTAGAVRSYIADKEAQGLEAPSLRGGRCRPGIRAWFPMSTRDPKADPLQNFTNAFVLLGLGLPVSESNPVDRMWEAKRLCDEMKTSPESVMVKFQTLVAQKLFSDNAFLKATFDMLDKGTLFFTNIVGRQEDMYFLNTKIDSAIFFVPSLMGSCIGICSFNGKLFLQAVTDSEVVPDPQLFLDKFGEELEALDCASSEQELRAPAKNCLKYSRLVIWLWFWISILQFFVRLLFF